MKNVETFSTEDGYPRLVRICDGLISVAGVGAFDSILEEVDGETEGSPVEASLTHKEFEQISELSSKIRDVKTAPGLIEITIDLSSGVVTARDPNGDGEVTAVAGRQVGRYWQSVDAIFDRGHITSPNTGDRDVGIAPARLARFSRLKPREKDAALRVRYASNPMKPGRTVMYAKLGSSCRIAVAGVDLTVNSDTVATAARGDRSYEEILADLSW